MEKLFTIGNSLIKSSGNFVANNTFFMNGSLALCAIASFEMGCRAVINLNNYKTKTDKNDKDQAYNNFSANLGGAFLLAVAAGNFFPATRKAAAVGFIIRSFYKFFTQNDNKYQEEYWSGKMVTFFPHRAYKSYEWAKSKVNLPSHPTWYLLIGLISLIGYYQLGGKLASYCSQN